MLPITLSGDSISSILATALMSEQIIFMLYHYNSSANASGVLYEPKTTALQRLFLTRAGSSFPNPLSCFYLNTLRDCVINTVASWVLFKPITFIIGWHHSIFLFLGSGSLSSFAYLFSIQAESPKLNRANDYAYASNGAFAGFATLSLILPKCHPPLWGRTPLSLFGAFYLLKCTYDEYIEPRYSGTLQGSDIRPQNRGFIGGVFFAFMYSSLFLRVRTDLGMLQVFYKNINRTAKL